MKYEGSVINHTDRKGNCRGKKEKWLPLKNVGHIDLPTHRSIDVHACARYGFYDQTCGQDDCPQMTTMTPTTTKPHGQFMIVHMVQVLLCQMSQNDIL